VITKTDRNSNF